MRRRRRSRGQALVEFAIVIPVIVIAVFGLLDLSRAIFTYNTLAQAARQAARMAIVDQSTDSVRAAAVAAGPTLGLGSSNISVCFKDSGTAQRSCASSTDDCPAGDRAIGCLAIVVVTVDYQPMTPVISSLWSSIPLTSTSILPVEYVCPSGSKTTCP